MGNAGVVPPVRRRRRRPGRLQGHVPIPPGQARGARREAEDASRRAAARERVLGLSYEDKLLLSEVSQRGFLDTEQGCDEDVRDLLWNVDDLVSGTEVGDYVWRIRLTDYGRYVVSVSGDILDEAVRP